jgi:hypothetical protein
MSLTSVTTPESLASFLSEVLRVGLQRVCEPARVADPQAGAIETRQQPLVRAQADGVDALDAGEVVPELRADARAAGVGGVDVHPRAEVSCNVGRSADGIDGVC